eukprot:c8890_g1_i8.p1 GENE.c8890_g1_i8~~c8890_g1_i8.p1  ORF type:complete len:170 (-),score=33.25 c8890_g1_i8:15-524(-)
MQPLYWLLQVVIIAMVVWTPLHCAILNDHIDVCFALIAHGASMDIQNGRMLKQTALEWATQLQRGVMMIELLKNVNDVMRRHFKENHIYSVLALQTYRKEQYSTFLFGSRDPNSPVSLLNADMLEVIRDFVLDPTALFRFDCDEKDIPNTNEVQTNPLFGDWDFLNITQ